MIDDIDRSRSMSPFSKLLWPLFLWILGGGDCQSPYGANFTFLLLLNYCVSDCRYPQLVYILSWWVRKRHAVCLRCCAWIGDVVWFIGKEDRQQLVKNAVTGRYRSTQGWSSLLWHSRQWETWLIHVACSTRTLWTTCRQLSGQFGCVSRSTSLRNSSTWFQSFLWYGQCGTWSSSPSSDWQVTFTVSLSSVIKTRWL